MAEYFKGMSKDKFVDDLVLATGLNGRELFDYMLSLIPREKEEEEKELKPTKEGTEFFGSLRELREYFLLRGGSEKMARFLGACAPDFAAAIVAGELGMDWFCWKKPIMGINKNWCFYAAFNSTTGKWDKMSDCGEDDWKKFLDNNRKPLPLNF